MSGEPSRVGLLSAHFFRRFLDNDLLSPNGDGHEHLAFVLALLAVPGLFLSAMLMVRYLNPLASPGLKMLFSLPDKLILLSAAMFVMALVTMVAWDALSLDSRDEANLGPLPIERGVLVKAKLAALARFVAVFAVGVNAIPAIGYPLILLATLPVGVGRMLWILGAHVFCLLAASLFGFLAVLACRDAIRVIVGPRVFRRVSTPIQFVGVLALVSAILLVPTVPSRAVVDLLTSGGPALAWWPPLWFLGLYERLTAGAILGAPGIDAPQRWMYWTREQDLAFRQQYLGMTDLLTYLSSLAMIALAASAAIGLAAFAIGAARRADPPAAPRPGLLRRALPRIAARTLVRHPVTQAGFFFTLQTIARSVEHRLYLAAYLAAGVGAALVMAGPSVVSRTGQGAAPGASAVFAVQMIVSFFILAGLRSTFAIPVTLPANWTFQICATGEAHRYHRGVRRAVAVILAGLFAGLLPLHVLWIDADTAALHLVAGYLAALIVAELAVVGGRHIPFTCPYVPGRENLKKWWLAYVAAFAAYTSGFTAIETRALSTSRGTAIFLLLLGLVFVAAIGVRRLRARRPTPIEFEPPEDVTQALGLSG
ncbi:MAG TPA: hypothetical protein VK886_16390 [Vicinamibacterales bacterium]|nr:hypothetical protein [Vicinamibacterales bacterium]